jgi:hypothetical protein
MVRKGATQNVRKAIATLLIALLAGIIILIIMASMGWGVGNKTLCRYSNWAGLSGFCTAENEVISAKDWDNCDSNFKDGFVASETEEERTDYAKKCASQQVLGLIKECWYRGGDGVWEPNSFMCWTFTVQIDEDLEQTKNELDDLAERVKTEIKQELGPGHTKLATELAKLTKEKKIYGLLVEYYTDRIYANIKDCVYGGTDASELAKDMAQEDSDVAKLLNENIDKTKPDCTISTSDLNTFKAGAVEFETKKETVEESLRAAAVKYGIASVETAKLVSDITAISDRIERFSIDEAYLEKVAKNTNILGTDKTYASHFRGNSVFDVLHDTEIRQGELYEIGYCNPPNAIGGGIAARFTCTMLKEGFGQSVQLTGAGGGASGTMRTGSVIPGYCNLFEIYTGDNWLINKLQAPRTWCKRLAENIIGPGPRT